jgi:CRP-like cAMP-binding protein
MKLGRPSRPAPPKPSEVADDRAQIDRVRRDALFANCVPLQLARLLGQLRPVTFAAGQELYARGAKADALYLLDSGDVEFVTESGRRVELRTSRCGEEAATDLKTYLATATARTPVRALGLPREALTELGLASRAMLGLGEPSERRVSVAGAEAGGGSNGSADSAQRTHRMAVSAVGAAPALLCRERIGPDAGGGGFRRHSGSHGADVAVRARRRVRAAAAGGRGGADGGAGAVRHRSRRLFVAHTDNAHWRVCAGLAHRRLGSELPGDDLVAAAAA